MEGLGKGPHEVVCMVVRRYGQGKEPTIGGGYERNDKVL
jgi:hypothetical protein